MNTRQARQGKSRILHTPAYINDAVTGLYERHLSRVDWRIPATLFVWILGLWLLSWVAVAASGITSTWMGEPTAAHFNQEREPLALYIWSRWDGQWYLNIAYGGYGTIPYDAPFFPMYPMLVAAMHAITPLPLAGDALLVSYIFLVLGLIYLYKLARLDLDRDLTTRAIITLILFPTAFFLVSVYTESLLLFLFCAALYYARLGRWWLVVPIAFAAGLTKIMAFALVLALFAEVLLGEANKPDGLRAVNWRRLLNPLTLGRLLISRLNIAKLAALVAAPLGLFTYMMFLYWRYGDPINFITVQPIRFWRVRRTFLEQVWFLLSRFSQGITAGDLPKLSDIFIMLFLVGLVIYLALKLRLSYAIFIVGFLIVLVMSGDTLSLNRYMLEMGPAFIGIAALTRHLPRTWAAMLTLFVPLQIYFALRYFLWNWSG